MFTTEEWIYSIYLKLAALQNGTLKACEASLHSFSSGNLNAVFYNNSIYMQYADKEHTVIVVFSGF